jgi:hypothetical protein
MATSEFNAEVGGNPVSLRMEVEEVRVPTWGGAVPDPDWKFTDQEGHDHYMAPPDTPHGERYPTLSWKPVMEYCADCEDTHDYGYYVCAKCGERITPGTRSEPPREIVMAGRRTYWIDDRQVDQEEFERVLEEVRAAQEEADRG